MKDIIELLREEMSAAFRDSGYDEKYAKVTTSDRPDLCQYQCSGALAAAKEYRKKPMDIAGDVVRALEGNAYLKKAVAQAPGFINLTVSDKLLTKFINDMEKSENLGCEKTDAPETIIIDYGGANVAKPLHVGHLRPAIIGESIKRVAAYLGHNAIGDAHLGDWGLQIGLVITELRHRQPELAYFDDSYEGEYPKEPPFSISDLGEIYPSASKKSKEDPEYKKEAQTATALLQEGKRGYVALWRHIIDVSLPDLKRIYDRLNVNFDLWKKESDAQPYIPDMVRRMKEGGYAYVDDGALVVDVEKESDAKRIPPCMILKSNGATLYNTTDLATIVERRELFNPTKIIYVVDKRQSLYFEQIFRCARKTGIIGDDVELVFIGNGTMNGSDGRPFKTRDGGVLGLESLLDDVYAKVLEKMKDRDMPEEDIKDAAEKIALAAVKYGDLSNQCSKDYIFDMERFTSFEGNTGPYILYTIVRIKSLLAKADKNGGKDRDLPISLAGGSDSEAGLVMALSGWPDAVNDAYNENAPHKICQFAYELSDAFNKFYHENRIVDNSDEKIRNSYIRICALVGRTLETAIDLLGLEAPERM